MWIGVTGGLTMWLAALVGMLTFLAAWVLVAGGDAGDDN